MSAIAARVSRSRSNERPISAWEGGRVLRDADMQTVAGPTRRVLEIMARNWLFLVFLAGGVALRLIALLAVHPVLFTSDAFAYLQRAITSSATGSFHPFLYPVLLQPFLATRELTWIPIVQHLAGLTMGVLLYSLLRRLNVHPFLAALGTVPVLLDAYQINFEHQVLSEAFFQLFVVVALVIVVWNERPSPITVGVVGLLIGASVLIRYVGLAVIVAVVIYALFRRFGWVRLGALAVGFLLPLLVYSLWFQSHSGSVGVTNRNGFFLYGRVVSFADCDEVNVPDHLRVYCPREDRREPKTQGLFTSGLPDEIRKDPSNNSDALMFARRMIAAKPEAYASAVLADFFTYFKPGDPGTRDPIDARWRWPQSIDDVRIHRHARKHGEVPPPGSGIPLHVDVDRDLAALLFNYQSVGWTHGPLLGILLLLGVVGIAVGWVRNRGRALGPESMLFTLAAIGLLLFPPVFAVYHFRYVLPAIPLVGPAGAIGAAALIRFIGSRRSGQPEHAGG